MENAISLSEVGGKFDNTHAHETGLKNIQRVDSDNALPVSASSLFLGEDLEEDDDDDNDNDNTGTGSSNFDKVKDQDISSRISSNPHQTSGGLSPSSPIAAEEFIIADGDETPGGNTDETGDSGKITGESSDALAQANNESDEKYQDQVNDDNVLYAQEIAMRQRGYTDNGDFNDESKVAAGSSVNELGSSFNNSPLQNVAVMKYNHKTETEMMKQWLEITVGLPQYYDIFMQTGYESLDIVKEIEDRSELNEIGIKPRGHQTKLLAEINKLREEFNGVRFIAPKFIPHVGSYGKVASFSPSPIDVGSPSLQFGDVQMQRNHIDDNDYGDVEDFKDSMEEVMKKKHRLYSDVQYIFEGDESDPSVENSNDELDVIPETPDMNNYDINGNNGGHHEINISPIGIDFEQQLADKQLGNDIMMDDIIDEIENGDDSDNDHPLTPQ